MTGMTYVAHASPCTDNCVLHAAVCFEVIDDKPGCGTLDAILYPLSQCAAGKDMPRLPCLSHFSTKFEKPGQISQAWRKMT